MQYWPKTQQQKKQTLAFAIGEGASYFSAPGVLVFCEDALPHQMEAVKRSLAKSVIEPNLPFFEKVSTWFGSKDPASKELNAPHTHDAQERKDHAYAISDAIVKYGVANFIGGSLVSILVQSGAERAMKTPGISGSDKVLMRATECAGHYGSAIILGTIFSPFAERSKAVVAKICQGIGFSKKDADNIGFATVYTVIPEFVGTLTGFLAMGHIMGRSSAARGI